MKNIFILTALMAMAIKTNAQIPNSGFETWEAYEDNYTHYIYEKPDLWVGSLPKNNAYSFSITKNAESYPAGTGQYSMKITPDIANGVVGIAISNDQFDPMISSIPKPSFAINYRPAALYLYFKYFPSGGDTMIAKVFFYRNGVVIGNPVYGTTNTVSNWTPLQIPMTYSTSDVPDSATIFFVTRAYVQHAESVLYIDNLSFNGFVTAVQEVSPENFGFNIYPNPSSDRITFNINNNNGDYITLNIYNALGEIVKKEILKQNQQQINIEDLSNGVYVAEIKSQHLTGRQKLFIQR